jgi:hypothetical protein
MRRPAVLFALLLTTGFCMGQGVITFQNSTATAITNIHTGDKAGTYTCVGFFVNADTNATSGFGSGWVQAGGWTNLTVPGIFLGGSRPLAGFPGESPVAVQVRAWTFSDHRLANFDDPSGWLALEGHSVVMIITPRVSPDPIPFLTANGLRPFTIGIIPEPSTITLALLGSALLGVIAPRRKRHGGD